MNEIFQLWSPHCESSCELTISVAYTSDTEIECDLSFAWSTGTAHGHGWLTRQQLEDFSGNLDQRYAADETTISLTDCEQGFHFELQIKEDTYIVQNLRLALHQGHGNVGAINAGPFQLSTEDVQRLVRAINSCLQAHE